MPKLLFALFFIFTLLSCKPIKKTSAMSQCMTPIGPIGAEVSDFSIFGGGIVRLEVPGGRVYQHMSNCSIFVPEVNNGK